MKKIILILLCLILNIDTYGVTYSSLYKGNVTGYYTAYPVTFTQSYQYEFKSTSSYMTSYQTVKPIGNDGFVSSEYTIQENLNKPRKSWGNLNNDDDDDPNASLVPIGDPPFILMMIFSILIMFYKQLKLVYKKKMDKIFN